MAEETNAGCDYLLSMSWSFPSTSHAGKNHLLGDGRYDMPLVQCSRNSICQAIGVSVEDLLGTFWSCKLCGIFHILSLCIGSGCYSWASLIFFFLIYKWFAVAFSLLGIVIDTVVMCKITWIFLVLLCSQESQGKWGWLAENPNLKHAESLKRMIKLKDRVLEGEWVSTELCKSSNLLWFQNDKQVSHGPASWFPKLCNL